MSYPSLSKSEFMSYLIKQTDFHTTDAAKSDAFLRLLIHSHLHGYFAHVGFHSTEAPLPRALDLHLCSVKQFSQAQGLQTQLVCKKLAKQFSEHGLKLTLLKGAAYIVANKQNAKGRLISDIDILVAKHQTPLVEKALKNSGWVTRELEDYDDKYYREWSHELPPYFHLESGVTLDVHHNLIPESSGKTVDIKQLLEKSVEVNNNLFIPNDPFLILHSAIHLLLNDDIEKGLRDCLDIHSLLLEQAQQQSLELLVTVFKQANCERELFVLTQLLIRLLGQNTAPYSQKLLSEIKLTKIRRWRANTKVSALFQAIFVQSTYLTNSKASIARLYVYLSGHLSKMPLSMFAKHITYKLYRGVLKKLFGEHIFRKSPPK